MSAGDRVNLIAGQIPEDYHCRCEYCQRAIGELRPEDGSYYSRLERRQYYDAAEKGKGGHIAKTPLHVARLAIQQYTEPGDFVLDPTIGAGTTAVEAITQGRSVAGMELEYGHIVEANVQRAMNGHSGITAKIGIGDARNIGPFLDEVEQKFTLVVNNPPYSGDVSMPSPKGKLRGKEHRHLETEFKYDRNLPNLAFLNEGEEYWQTMRSIYADCIDHLKSGGHFVLGIKDMSRNWEPFLLHRNFCDLLAARDDMEFVGTAFLKHYPLTLHLNTYASKKGNVNHVKPPMYQTISVFRKS